MVYNDGLFYKCLVPLIPGPPAAASHRRTAWHGDHGMACMVAHRRARRGAADLMQSCSLSDYCTAGGRTGPKSKVPAATRRQASPMEASLRNHVPAEKDFNGQFLMVHEYKTA